MSAYLIGTITLQDPAGYQDYVAQVPAFVAKWGGEYLVRGGTVTVQEGDWEPGRMVVIRFPDRASAEGFVNDPEYGPVAAIRHKAATSNLVIVDGAD